MKSPGTIDLLKKRLFFVKKNLKALRENSGPPKKEYSNKRKYVECCSIDNNIILIQPSNLAESKLGSRNYKSPPCTRQQSIDSLRVIDLANPETWNTIYKKLQNLNSKEESEDDIEQSNDKENEEGPRGILSVDCNTVVYMTHEDSNCSSRGTKTPVQSKFPSRDENTSLASSQNLQKLYGKLLAVKEEEEKTEGDLLPDSEMHDIDP